MAYKDLRVQVRELALAQTDAENATAEKNPRAGVDKLNQIWEQFDASAGQWAFDRF